MGTALTTLIVPPDPLTYTWTGTFGTATGVSHTVSMSPGISNVTLTAAVTTAALLLSSIVTPTVAALRLLLMTLKLQQYQI